MKFRTPGQFKSTTELRERLQEIDCELGATGNPEGAAGPLGQPLQVAGWRLGNRFAIHPMEGWDGTAAGDPTPLTLRRWRRFGRSTAKLIWGGEAYAVRADGRANPHQLFRNGDGDPAASLAALLAEVRAGHSEMGADPDELVVGLQLTHSGRYAFPTDHPEPKLTVRSPVLDARQGISQDAQLLTDGELEAIGEDYVACARLASDVGFHFVDVKACHGYLVHELLGARHRPGPYGGDLAGRARFLLRVLAGIRSECPQLTLGVRLCVGDVFPHSPPPGGGAGETPGWDGERPYTHGFGLDPLDPLQPSLAEPLEVLGWLRDCGVELVSTTLGSPYYTPHLQRPAAYPPSDGYEPPRDPLHEVACHLGATRQCKAAFPELTIVGAGYSYLMEYLPHVAEHEVASGHVDLVGIGRLALTYPAFVDDFLCGHPLERKLICRTFSDCTTAPRFGLRSGCYPLDPEYRQSAEKATLERLKRTARAPDGRTRDGLESG